MGAVYEAEQLGLQRRVALKLLEGEGLERHSALERFMREGQMMARLNHPGVVRVFELGRDGARHFIAMELIEGKDLEAVLLEGPLPVAETVRIVAAVLDTLEAVHQHGVIHRDLKPANVMLSGSSVRLVDFGVALLRELENQPRLTRKGTSPGTLAYMSPEQLRGEPADVRSDLYAMGALSYEALTGRLPFDSPLDAELMSAHLYTPAPRFAEVAPERNLGQALEGVVLRALEKRPESRFSTALEMREAWLAAASEQARGKSGRPAEEFLPPISGAPANARVAILGGASDRATRDMLRNAIAVAGWAEVANPAEAQAVVVLAESPQAGLLSARTLMKQVSCPVLLCAPEGDVAWLTETISAGVFDILPAPLDPSHAVSRLTQALKRRRNS